MNKFENTMVIVVCVVLLAVFFFLSGADADTVHLKNGQSLTGIISREDKEVVELNVGCGVVILKKHEIDRLSRATLQENEDIRKGWDKNKVYTEKSKISAQKTKNKMAEKWAAIVAEIDAQRLFDEERHQIEVNAKIVPVTLDAQGHFIVDVVLNNNVHAFLVVDTGAPDVILTANIARQLGVDFDGITETYESMFLNGKHKVGIVTLKSMKLGNLEEKDIKTDVMFEDDKEIEGALRDGLLGLEFLKRFDIALDSKNSTLIFKKLAVVDNPKKKQHPYRDAQER
jgi:clan AA aspartic protease (TIGR02281 family)